MLILFKLSKVRLEKVDSCRSHTIRLPTHAQIHGAQFTESQLTQVRMARAQLSKAQTTHAQIAETQLKVRTRQRT
jgi:uncharacterized protein YjbI with pentapeptide repeats